MKHNNLDLKKQNTVYDHTTKVSLNFSPKNTVSQTLLLLKKDTNYWPNTEFIYVVDNNKKLIGIVPFRKIITSSPNTYLGDIMQTKFTYLSPNTHQETAAKIAIKENLQSLPVIDSDGKFIGIVSANEIFKILHENHIDKLMRLSGVLLGANKNLNDTSAIHAIKMRLPWLIAGLAGGIGSTYIVDQFSEILSKHLVLAFFIPVIVYMNDAVGTQTQTVYVRNATLKKINLAKSLLSELKISFAIGLILGTTIGIYTKIYYGDFWLGITVGSSMAIGILSSAIIGTLIPFFIEKSGRDPAVGSGPFATIVQDITSIVIYFSVASVFLKI
ncbi:MAG: magnesium transporter [Patescibacteria group bacterium]|nr:magnesium transporter [Patescibacteria group bacterium]